MKTEIILLTDVSGSMRVIDRATCQALNMFIEEQRTVPGEARVTHLRFNTDVHTDFEGRLLASVPRFQSLNTGGGTALYDAVISTLAAQHQRIRKEAWADQVIFVISTDGEDINSRRTKGAARAAIEEMQDHGWQFVFLGANINAERYAEELSITVSFQYDQTAAGVAQGMQTVSQSVRQMRSWGL